MGTESTTAKQLRLDERNHVEKPLLDQLAGLAWEVIDLTDMKQTPADTHRLRSAASRPASPRGTVGSGRRS